VTKRLIAVLSVIALLIMGTGFGIHLSNDSSWTFGAASVGQCWTGLASSVDAGVASGLRSVDCAAPHSNETIAITKLPATVTKLPMRTSDPLLTPMQELNLYKTIVKPIVGTLDMGGVAKSRLVAWTYPPTITQWNHGARWLRVDFFLENPGWPQDFIEPDLALRGKIQDLVAVAKKNPDLIRTCVDTASNDDLPTANPGARILADCTQNPRWHLVAVTNLVNGRSESFPGASTVTARATAACEAFLGTGVYAITFTNQTGTYINQRTWDPRYTSSDCWISKKP
jgi:hypothetical protein